MKGICEGCSHERESKNKSQACQACRKFGKLAKFQEKVNRGDILGDATLLRNCCSGWFSCGRRAKSSPMRR